MSEYNRANARNFGFWTEQEQERLSNAKIAIAGAGGDGFQLGYKLAMMGVGHINVADPEVFEQENSNRVFGATSSNCGRNKAEVFQEMVSELPRDIEINVFSDGVTQENVDEFMHNANLVIDESELRYPHIGTLLARKAIQYDTPELYVMNIGFAGVATSFKPDPSSGFERLMGIPTTMPLDEVADLTIPYSRMIPYIPNYANFNTFMSVTEGASLPSVSPGVDAASAIGSTEALLHLAGDISGRRKRPVWSPRFRYLDAYTNKGGTIHFPRLSHHVGVVAMYARHKLGAAAPASYSLADLSRRNEL